MRKIKAVFFNIYVLIHSKAEAVARWSGEVNWAQAELAQVPEVILDKSGEKYARETFVYIPGSPVEYYR